MVQCVSQLVQDSWPPCVMGHGVDSEIVRAVTLRHLRGGGSLSLQHLLITACSLYQVEAGPWSPSATIEEMFSVGTSQLHNQISGVEWTVELSTNLHSARSPEKAPTTTFYLLKEPSLLVLLQLRICQRQYAKH